MLRGKPGQHVADVGEKERASGIGNLVKHGVSGKQAGAAAGPGAPGCADRFPDGYRAYPAAMLDD